MRDRWITSTLQMYEGDPRPAHAYVGADGETVTLSRAQLLTSVRESAGRLLATGLRTGDRVALVAADPGPFVRAFLGAVWAGLVPVPVPPPPPLGRRDVWCEALGEALRIAEPHALVAPETTLPLLSGIRTHPLSSKEPNSSARTHLSAYPNSHAYAYSYSYSYEFLDTVDAVGPQEPVPFRADRTVYLQFSSGSTGRPRAVAATAGAVTANAHAIMRHGLAVDPDRDHAVSWLPLHHDMGLVGFVLAPLVAGLPVTLLPARTFVRDPGVWMRTMSQVRGTITFAPNFAFGLAARRVRAEDVAGLDLSSVRVLGCGGEPVNTRTLHGFTEAYAGAGLDPAALLPCFGLAESTLAVTFGARGRGARADAVSPAALRDTDRAVPAGGGEEPLEVVNCGRPFPGHEVTVVDGRGAIRPDRSIGEIWVRGPSVAAGYIGDDADAETFREDGWLRTGDRGYLADGELRVTGRLKDVLVVNGRNTDPTRLEWLVEALPGVRAGGVVAFTRPASPSSLFAPSSHTEEVVVVVECRADAAPALDGSVRRVVAEHLALDVRDVVTVGPGTIPRTTSGKPRRQETRRRYLSAQLAAHLPAPPTVPHPRTEAHDVHSG
ncbi:AMP-binding protein [Streptomyces sp. NPDC057137]|uniref:AMP-binding protein n=1 Tax=Streptomyces sp. NPDC057137 TaxID=3346030 RepID=UPI003639B445